MTDLKIRVTHMPDETPAQTVTIPGGLLRIARRLVPNRAVEALRVEGIDMDELVRLSEDATVRGTIADIVDHEKNQHVVISLE